MLFFIQLLTRQKPSPDNPFFHRRNNAMNRKLAVISLSAFFLAILVAGCCGGGGEKTTVVTQPAPAAPVGEELIKLKEAYDKGAITKEEYEQTKERILKGQ
jgi:uncharacterized membrane protein